MLSSTQSMFIKHMSASLKIDRIGDDLSLFASAYHEGYAFKAAVDTSVS
jgi:hypothetical protein